MCSAVGVGLSPNAVAVGRLFGAIAWSSFGLELAAEISSPSTTSVMDGTGFSQQERLASLILVFSFMRVLKENNGASDDFYYWIARGTLWMQLLIVGPVVVSMFLIVGNLLTIPLDGGTGL